MLCKNYYYFFVKLKIFREKVGHVIVLNTKLTTHFTPKLDLHGNWFKLQGFSFKKIPRDSLFQLYAFVALHLGCESKLWNVNVCGSKCSKLDRWFVLEDKSWTLHESTWRQNNAPGIPVSGSSTVLFIRYKMWSSESLLSRSVQWSSRAL